MYGLSGLLWNLSRGIWYQADEFSLPRFSPTEGCSFHTVSLHLQIIWKITNENFTPPKLNYFRGKHVEWFTGYLFLHFLRC